jgi:hypothetical protein
MINKEHEVMSAAVIFGSIVAIAGSLLISFDTGYFVEMLGLPHVMGSLLSYKLVGG